MQVATLAPLHHQPVPVQPEVGSLQYTYADGTTREFRIRPFIHEPSDFPARFASIVDARAAVLEHNGDFLGVAFGIFQAEAGAYAIRPLESHNGSAFVIDGPEIGPRLARASAEAGSSLMGIVGLSSWIDLSDPGKRVLQPVVSFHAG